MKERLFKLRMAQLDLARQMETVEYVQNFIDFISRYDYNAFFLYIEWRIRTDTFDIGEKKGLSKDEIRQIVAYAAERGVDVIPALNCFGHSGELLSRQEYHELAELKDGQTGLEHSGDKHVFCLSNPKSKAFIASYIKEVAELFPAQYIHIGFDEALDVGFCPECAEKCAGAAGEQRLILEHLEFCRNTAVQCGKRSIIWDDMLPNSAGILLLPRGSITRMFRSSPLTASTPLSATPCRNSVKPDLIPLWPLPICRGSTMILSPPMEDGREQWAD